MALNQSERRSLAAHHSALQAHDPPMRGKGGAERLAGGCGGGWGSRSRRCFWKSFCSSSESVSWSSDFRLHLLPLPLVLSILYIPGFKSQRRPLGHRGQTLQSTPGAQHLCKPSLGFWLPAPECSLLGSHFPALYLNTREHTCLECARTVLHVACMSHST